MPISVSSSNASKSSQLRHSPSILERLATFDSTQAMSGHIERILPLLPVRYSFISPAIGVHCSIGTVSRLGGVDATIVVASACEDTLRMARHEGCCLFLVHCFVRCQL